MVHSNKEEIARLKRERRQAKADKRRRENVRPKLVRFLIVCEGSKTEPQYFEALINKHVSTVREVHIQGEGMGTVALVDQAQAIRLSLERSNSMKFDRVWVVFDKDDFGDFNEAIRKAGRFGMRSAWSNEAFELWYYLHFEFLDTAISRTAYIEKIERVLRKAMNDPKFAYQKGNPNIYHLLQKYGNERHAMAHAKRLRSGYRDKDYASHKPCTTVELLVNELEHPEKLLDQK